MIVDLFCLRFSQCGGKGVFITFIFPLRKMRTMKMNDLFRNHSDDNWWN